MQKQDIDKKEKAALPKVLILDGNSEIGAHIGSSIFSLICFRRLFRSRTVTNRIFLSEKTIFFIFL